MKLNVILACIAIVTAVVGGLGVTYAGADRFFSLEERVAANTKTLQQDKFFLLDQRKEKGYPLSQDDWQKWCTWGKRYKFLDRCGQRPGQGRGKRAPRPLPRPTR